MTPEIIDQASELEEMLRENAIAAHRLNPNAHCEECAEELPEPRRKAYPGCTMCVACLQIVELRNKQRGM